MAYGQRNEPWGYDAHDITHNIKSTTHNMGGANPKQGGERMAPEILTAVGTA